MKNLFSFLKYRLIELSEFRAVSAYASVEGDDCFLESDQLFANWFFVNKERMNFVQNLKQCIRRESPCHLVSLRRRFVASINKMKLTPESLYEPFKAWCFCIIALQKDFIRRIGSIFRMAFLNIQTAFRINKSSQICITRILGHNSVSKWSKFFFNRRFNDVVKFFGISHSCNSGFFRKDIIVVDEFFKNNTLFVFLYNEFFYYKKIFKNRAFNHQTLNLFPNRIATSLAAEIPSKFSLKPLKVLQACRVNYSHSSISSPASGSIFPNVKAAITVKITSCISKIGIFNHAMRIVDWGI